ncbi:hypothetical protein BDW74DRAFT_176699 [Aspergillus multicolor]|uniref:uncharacterized protein n=1 Tax=Aspergillus multicolor TaxID=41759 RepID=UPI003CCD5B93
MKLSLAVALHLSLLAAAAPTLALKRANGDAPSADMTDKIAYGSLMSAAEMMDLYSRENGEATDDETAAGAKAAAKSKANEPDVGTNMPANMTPNSMANFPAADGTQGSTRSKASKDAAALPSPSPAAASPSPTPSPAAADDDEEDDDDDEDVEDKKVNDAAASPSAAASSPAAQKKKNMLEGLPVLGSALGGLTGGLGGGAL